MIETVGRGEYISRRGRKDHDSRHGTFAVISWAKLNPEGGGSGRGAGGGSEKLSKDNGRALNTRSEF